MIYTVMWKGQLVRFNPVTRNVGIIAGQCTSQYSQRKRAIGGKHLLYLFAAGTQYALFLHGGLQHDWTGGCVKAG